MSQNSTQKAADKEAEALKQIDRQHRFKFLERFAHFMSRLTNPIFLSFFFFVIFTPFAICYRLFSSQSFRRKEKNAKSSWVVNSTKAPIQLEDQF